MLLHVRAQACMRACVHVSVWHASARMCVNVCACVCMCVVREGACVCACVHVCVSRKRACMPRAGVLWPSSHAFLGSGNAGGAIVGMGARESTRPALSVTHCICSQGIRPKAYAERAVINGNDVGLGFRCVDAPTYVCTPRSLCTPRTHMSVRTTRMPWVGRGLS